MNEVDTSMSTSPDGRGAERGAEGLPVHDEAGTIRTKGQSARREQVL